MKKRIALIMERAHIILGGAERSTFELATALSGQNLQVNILAAKGRTNAKKIHLLCADAPGKRTSYSTFARALKKHLSQNHYDIIHSILPFDFADVYQPRGGTYAESMLRNASSFQNRPLQFYKKATAFANIHRTILLRAEKRLCRNPNGPIVVALSEYVARQFRQHYNLAEDRLITIPNGIRINRRVDTGKVDKLRTQILAKLNLKEADDPIFFLFVANNFRLKGLAVLVQALHNAIYNYAAYNAYLIVVGRGSACKYRHLARKLKVNKKIVFLGKVRTIQNALSMADVAVLPTFYDPSSRFILEALAADMPVITTKFNGATDLFVHNRHGIVVDDPENTHALAQAISHFTNPENLKKTSQAIVQDNIREKISVTRVARQLKSLYDSILQNRKTE